MDSTRATALEILENGAMQYPHVGRGIENAREESIHHQSLSNGFQSNSIDTTIDHDGTALPYDNANAAWGSFSSQRAQPNERDFDTTESTIAHCSGDYSETAVTAAQPAQAGFGGDFNPTSSQQYPVDTSSRAQPHRNISTEPNKGSIQNSQNSIPDSFVPVPVRLAEASVPVLPNNNAGIDTSVQFDVMRFSSINTSDPKNASDLNSSRTIHLEHVRENSITSSTVSCGDKTRVIETHQYASRVLPIKNSMCSPSDIDGDNKANTTTTVTATQIERPSRGTLSNIDSNTNLDTNNNSEGVSRQPGSTEQLEAARCRYGGGSSAFEVYRRGVKNGTKISRGGEQDSAATSDSAKDYGGRMRMDSARELSPHRSSGSLNEKMEADKQYHPQRIPNNGSQGAPPSTALFAYSDDFTPSRMADENDQGKWRSMGETAAGAVASERSLAPAVGVPYASSTGQPPTNETLPSQQYGTGAGGAEGSTTTAAAMASAAMGALSSPNAASLPAPPGSLWGAGDLSLDCSEKKEGVASNGADRKGTFSAEASPTSRSQDTEATASTSTASWVEQDSLPSQRMFFPSAPTSASASQSRRPDNLPFRVEKSPVLPPSHEASSERIKEEAFKRRSHSWDEQFAAPAPSGARFAASSYHRSSSSGVDRASSTASRNYPPVVKARQSMLPQSQHQPSPSRSRNQQQQQQQQQWAAQQHQMLMHKAPTMQSWPEQQQRQRMPYQQPDDSSYPQSNDASPLSSPSLSPRMTSQVPPPIYQDGITHEQQSGVQFSPSRFQSHRDNAEVPIQHIRELVPSHRPHHHSSPGAGGQQQFHSRHQQQYTAQSHHIHAAPSAHQIPLHQRMGGYGHHQPNYNMPSSLGYASGPPPAPSSVTGIPQHMQGRNIQHHGGGPPPGSAPPPNPSAARSPPEILKTLLRKKACLYEPGTSRAIALATWLVGRRLALAHGYFSRQQLQSGVHAAASSKIESGVITRTKVNRCMQIILNSCFHYIIPRPDGSEEKGDVFQKAFAERAVDDGHLLRELPAPWDDVVINGDLVESAIQKGSDKTDDEADDDTPPSSGRGRQTKRRGSTNSADGKDGGSGPGTSAGIKRAVLLCFNENVRSAEDVFRCHNEFIRDAAHSANLQLTAQDWRAFFSGEDVAAATSSGFGDRLVPQQQQVDLPTSMQLPSSASVFSLEGMGLFKKTTPETISAQPTDVLGCMTASELSRFRTTWCSKRYDHDPALCFFAHVEINRGWLRRDTRVRNYAPQMCPHIKAVPSATTTAPGPKSKGGGSSQSAAKCFFNTCPDGVNCAYAHSKEEIDYHPDRYKKRVCNAATVTAIASGRGTQPSCPQRDICPHIHPPGQQHAHAAASPQSKQHYPRHGSQRRGDSPGRGGKRHTVASTGTTSSAGPDQQPSGAPMLYVSPAPKSDFEASLMLPGLKDLFRRHSSTLYALHCGSSPSSCNYSNFGDDWGLPDIQKSGE